MRIKRRFLLHIVPFYIILSLGIIIIYLIMPFDNECVHGSCNNGYGIYLYDSGIQYEGEWKSGKKHGKGTLTYPDGSKYAGEWKNNKYHGNGTKTYVNRQLLYYSGEWKNGKKHGKGIQYFSPKEWYEGAWKNGQMNGLGTYITARNHKYVGEWKNRQMHGSGIIYYPDGRIFTGKWKNNQKIGHGTLTYPDGSKISEQWKDGKLVGSLDFFMIDFDGEYKLMELYKAIEANIDIRFKKQHTTIKRLNVILETPNLYELLHDRLDKSALSGEMKTLIEHTKMYRNKNLLELPIKIQNDIKLLNRLLLEHCYPKKTPKVKR